MKICLALTLLLAYSFAVSFGQTSYYVSTGGNNANAGTSPAAPWRTIQYAVDHVGPGAIINVMGGVYNEKINWSISGSPGLPVILQNYLSETPVISGNGIASPAAIIYIENKSHIQLKNLILENNYQQDARGIFARGEGSQLTIEGCKIRNIGFTNNPLTDPYSVSPAGQAHGILVNGRTSTGYQNIYIRNNELHNLVTGNSEALTLVGNVSNFEITGNTLHDNTNIGIDIAGHYAWAVEAGVPSNLNQARNGVVVRNIAYNHRRFSNADAPAGIYTDGGKDLVIEHNIVFRNGNGFSVGCETAGKTASNVVVRNNLAFDNDNNGIVFGANTGDIVNCQFRNNTFLKNGSIAPFNMEVFLQKSTDCVVANNVLYARSLSHYGIGLFSYTTVNLVIDRNLVFREGADLSNLITGSPAIPANTNTLIANPQLVNAVLPSPDLHLQPGSPAINYGSNAYLTVGEKDIDQGVRSTAAFVDAGADESGSQGCLSALYFPGILPAGNYQAADGIEATGKVEATASVGLLAPSITLGAGFEVILGGVFAAVGGGCVVLP